MKLIRIIPLLLIKNNFLIKGENFKNHQYVGDIYNAVKIFSEKSSHELILLDTEATKNNRTFDIDIIKKIKKEIFVPLTVGGGINNLEQVTKLINEGVEKVTINSILSKKTKILSSVAKKFGSQSLVVSLDIRRIDNEYLIFFNNGSVQSRSNLKAFIKFLENEGVGEILITSVDKEGTRSGFDIDLFKELDDLTSIPIIANGGANNMDDFQELFDKTKISAASGGACFTFYGKRKAVLINYPSLQSVNDLMERYEK
jgi:cyclase